MSDARHIETISDVETVLESPRVSFNELQDCVEVAKSQGRWDLTKAAAERSINESVQRPSAQSVHMDWALDTIVSSRLKQPSSLEQLPEAIEGLIEWMYKLRTRIEKAHPVLEVRLKEKDLAAVLVLLANPDPPALIQLCSKLRKLDRADLGVIAATRALDAGGDQSVALTTRGAAKSDLKDYRGAIKDLRIVLDENPESTYALTSISRAYQELGDLDSALTCAERALETDPKNKFAAHRLMSVAVKSNDFGAIEIARQKLDAIGFDLNPEAHRLIDLYVAEALFEEGRFEESKRMLGLAKIGGSTGELKLRILSLNRKLRDINRGQQPSLNL